MWVGSGKNRVSCYGCMNCQFNTIPHGIVKKDSNDLVIMVLRYKGKYLKIPQQIVFDRLLELYRFNQEEQINQEKFYVRSKRKFIQFYVPGKVRRS